MKEAFLYKLKSDNRVLLLLFAISMLCIFTLIYILNFLYPLFADDWTYSFIYGSDNIRISSISDIVKSQYNHYYTWGGRTIGHFIAQFLLFINFELACLINSLAYIALIFSLYLIINKHNKIDPVLFSLISVMIWFFTPGFYGTVVWKTGSANYLWGALFCFLFIYQYYSYYRQIGYSADKLTKSILMFILGLIAGWTNENMSIAVISYVILSLFLYFFEKKRIPRWGIAGLIGILIGCFLLLSAPGNYIRLSNTLIGLSERGLEGSTLFFFSFKNILRHLRDYLLILISIYIVLLFIYNKYPKDLLNKRSVMISSLLFILTAGIAHLAMIASPMYHVRSLFGIIMLLIAAIGIIYSNIDYKKTFLKQLNYIIIAVSFFAFGWTYYIQYNDVSILSSFWKDREIFVLEQKSRGIDTIVFNKRSPMEYKYFIYELSHDPEIWENREYSRFYGVKTVQAPKRKDIN